MLGMEGLPEELARARLSLIAPTAILSVTPSKEEIASLLVESEELYLAHVLFTLEELYRKPLTHLPKPILTEQHAKTLFAQVPDLTTPHVALMSRIKKSAIEDLPLFIRDFVDKNGDLYEQYLMGFNDAMALLQKLSESDKKFADFIQKQAAASHGKSLKVLLAAPAYRLTGWREYLELFLKDEISDEFYKKIKKAVRAIDRVLQSVLTHQRNMEEVSLLEQIEKDIFKGHLILERSKTAIRIGHFKEYRPKMDESFQIIWKNVGILRSTKEVVLVLFNDSVILANEGSGKPRLILKLRDIAKVIDDHTSGKNSFALLTNSEERVVLFAKNEAEKHSWIQSIFDAILAQKLETIEHSKTKDLEEVPEPPDTDYSSTDEKELALERAEAATRTSALFAENFEDGTRKAAYFDAKDEEFVERVRLSSPFSPDFTRERKIVAKSLPVLLKQYEILHRVRLSLENLEELAKFDEEMYAELKKDDIKSLYLESFKAIKSGDLIQHALSRQSTFRERWKPKRMSDVLIEVANSEVKK